MLQKKKKKKKLFPERLFLNAFAVTSLMNF